MTIRESRVGNLILEYEDQIKLAVLASVLIKHSRDVQAIEIAEEFLDWVGDTLEPEEV